MDKLQLFYSPTTKQYYSDIDKINCSACNNIIDEVMIHCQTFSKKARQENCFCRNCFKEAKNNNKFGVVTEFKIIVLTQDIPKDAIFFIMRYPVLKPCYDVNVFNAAVKKLDSEKVIDRAWRSKVKNFMIDPNYKEFDIKKDNKKDLPLNNTEFTQYLEHITELKPLIEETKIKRLK